MDKTMYHVEVEWTSTDEALEKGDKAQVHRAVYQPLWMDYPQSEWAKMVRFCKTGIRRGIVFKEQYIGQTNLMEKATIPPGDFMNIILEDCRIEADVDGVWTSRVEISTSFRYKKNDGDTFAKFLDSIKRRVDTQATIRRVTRVDGPAYMKTIEMMVATFVAHVKGIKVNMDDNLMPLFEKYVDEYLQDMYIIRDQLIVFTKETPMFLFKETAKGSGHLAPGTILLIPSPGHANVVNAKTNEIITSVYDACGGGKRPEVFELLVEIATKQRDTLSDNDNWNKTQKEREAVYTVVANSLVLLSNEKLVPMYNTIVATRARLSAIHVCEKIKEHNIDRIDWQLKNSISSTNELHDCMSDLISELCSIVKLIRYTVDLFGLIGACFIIDNTAMEVLRDNAKLLNETIFNFTIPVATPVSSNNSSPKVIDIPNKEYHEPYIEDTPYFGDLMPKDEPSIIITTTHNIPEGPPLNLNILTDTTELPSIDVQPPQSQNTSTAPKEDTPPIVVQPPPSTQVSTLSDGGVKTEETGAKESDEKTDDDLQKLFADLLRDVDEPIITKPVFTEPVTKPRQETRYDFNNLLGGRRAKNATIQQSTNDLQTWVNHSN